MDIKGEAIYGTHPVALDERGQLSELIDEVRPHERRVEVEAQDHPVREDRLELGHAGLVGR